MRKEIGFINVKQLYDAAFDEKAKARSNIKRFRRLYKKAEKLDLAYRAQLARKPALSYGRAA